MKLIKTMPALIIAVLVLPISAFGEGNKTSNDEVIDNIVTVGQKSVADLRRDVYKAEEEFYSVFNRLNDENDYDVRCFYEKATGTHIKNHVCRARFVSKAYSQNAAKNRNNLSRVANQSANPVFAEKTAKYQEKMESLIAANPELQNALIRYNTARAEFTANREEIASN